MGDHVAFFSSLLKRLKLASQAVKYEWPGLSAFPMGCKKIAC